MRHLSLNAYFDLYDIQMGHIDQLGRLFIWAVLPGQELPRIVR